MRYFELHFHAHRLDVRGSKYLAWIAPGIARHNMHMIMRFGLPGVHTVVLEDVQPRSAECPDKGPANLRCLRIHRGEEVRTYVQRR